VYGDAGGVYAAVDGRPKAGGAWAARCDREDACEIGREISREVGARGVGDEGKRAGRLADVGKVHAHVVMRWEPQWVPQCLPQWVP
jgi:hypothetical protein